jgi:hypothetical protein
MAYDESVLARLRDALRGLALEPGEALAERKMFGGVCVTLNGKMLAGVSDARLVVRLEPQELEVAEARGVAAPMDLTGRPLKGFAFVDPAKLEGDAEWGAWLDTSARYVRRHMLPKRDTRPGL